MKKTTKIFLFVCFFLAIGIYSQAQGYCNSSPRYASCNSYGAGSAGGEWTLTSPTGQAQLVVDLDSYEYGNALADVGSNPGVINAMYNIWGADQHDGTNVYLSGLPSTVTVFISIYASENATAYAAVLMF